MQITVFVQLSEHVLIITDNAYNYSIVAGIFYFDTRGLFH